MNFSRNSARKTGTTTIRSFFVFGPNLLGSPTLPSSSVITNVGLPDQTNFILISHPTGGWYSHDKAVSIFVILSAEKVCRLFRYRSEACSTSLAAS
jgi:hypothetical protein